MDDIRLFIKRNAKDKLSLSINYYDTYNSYKYKYLGNNIQFNEHLPSDVDCDATIEMILNNKTYNNYTDIQLALYDLFDYKNIDYIDIYIQKKILSTSIILSDMYDDYYDDINKKLICTRRLTINDKELMKLKFIIIEDDITLYYQTFSINGYDNIIKKIDEIISSNQ